MVSYTDFDVRKQISYLERYSKPHIKLLYVFCRGKIIPKYDMLEQRKMTARAKTETRRRNSFMVDD